MRTPWAHLFWPGAFGRLATQHDDAGHSDADEVDAELRRGLGGDAQSPTVAATTANPAAGTVVTEMNTPTSAADFDDTNDSMPAAPANNATTNENGPDLEDEVHLAELLVRFQLHPPHRFDEKRERPP